MVHLDDEPPTVIILTEKLHTEINDVLEVVLYIVDDERRLDDDDDTREYDEVDLVIILDHLDELDFLLNYLILALSALLDDEVEFEDVIDELVLIDDETENDHIDEV